MKVSLVCTVKNEEDTIDSLISSIVNQTKKPDEIVIVDGGSTDKTVQKIKSIATTIDIPLKLIVAEGANIARGRNIAIENSRYDIIAVTDAGCVLKEDWLSKITEPLKNPDIDVVAGAYLPLYDNEVGEILSYIIMSVNLRELDLKRFLPSSRSIAFKKSAWDRVGGYPEWLDTAEDTYFDLKMRKNGMKFMLVRDAIVYWRIKGRLRDIFKQFYRYGEGNGLALIYLPKYLAVYGTIITLLILILLLQSYWKLLFPLSIIMLTILGLKYWLRNLKRVKNLTFRRTIIALTIISLISIGILLGFFIGLLNRIKMSILHKNRSLI